MSLRSVVPALLIASVNLLSIGTAHAQAASSNSTRPSTSVRPNQAAPAYFTVTPTGPIKDSSGNYSSLVGQQCSARINLPPYIYGTTIAYQWKVSGTTFQSWSVVADPNNQSHTTETDGFGDPTQATITWYWNDKQSTPETISCTVTATPPAGQTNPNGTGGSGTVNVSVQVPKYTFTAAPGYMQINTKAYNQGGALDLYAGPPGGGSGGIVWTATCTTPTTPAFGKGSVELIQIATPNLSYTAYTGSMVPGAQHNDPENGKTGLDGQCPYPGSSYTEGGSNPFTSNDSPTAPLSNSMGSITMTHQFVDYLMYLAPGSSQAVPLATLTWGTNGSASIPSTGNWGDYAVQNGSDSAGTVTATNATASNTFPSWTLVNGPVAIGSF